MKVYIYFVFCVVAIYVRECENLKILKKIHDFLHPPQATTTSVPILPTFSGGEDYAGEDGRTSTTPWSEVGVGGVGPSDSFTTVLTPSNNYYNNENKNGHSPQSISPTSQPPKTLGGKTIENFETKEYTNVWVSTEKSVFSNNDEMPQSSNNINTQNENNVDSTLLNSIKQKYPYQPNNDHSYTQELPYAVTTIKNVHNADDYVTEATRKQPTNINMGDQVNNNYNQQQPPNSNNQQELTNNEKDRKSNSGHEHSAIPEEENQPPLGPNNKHQPHTTNNQFQLSTSEKTSSNQRNNEVSTQTQGEIPLDEGGPIVFPTEANSGAYLEPTRKYIKDDGHKGSSYAESTTGRTAKAPVPVGDGGRVVIDAPTKKCPKGSQLDDGECRKIS